jgi:hypothetical protein
MAQRTDTAVPHRAMARIDARLDTKLCAYMAAAGATGVGMLALVQPSDAKIVYTPANVTLSGSFATIPLDLNNDGVVDLNFQYTGITYGTALFAYPVAGNGAIVGHSGAAALPWGTRIGPKGDFHSYRMAIAGRDGCHPYCSSFGDWINKKGWFLGIKFSVGGQTHYGWARLSVGKPVGVLTAVLTGYAYETIADKPIIAGKTSGFDGVSALRPQDRLGPVSKPDTLGLLARGADGLAVWRREEDDVAQKMNGQAS